MTRVRRFLDKHVRLGSRNGQRGVFRCQRCEQQFRGLIAYDRHVVWYAAAKEYWCELAEDVGLVPSTAGWQIAKEAA